MLTSVGVERRALRPWLSVYFSQRSVLYRDKECRAGGWPVQPPNPNAKRMHTARKLVDVSYDVVGLERP